MGSFINFKNFGGTSQPDGGGGKPTGDFPLARQSSVYSLTFDELQNTFGGVGKDVGSMNMEDLLKNIWTADETQAMASSAGAAADGSVPGGNLLRQGSVTLPRTLSQKTVDEVWRDFVKENTRDAKDGGGAGGSNLGGRQSTLGEMTLEEFLAKAGVVREDVQQSMKPNNGGFYGGVAQPRTNNSGLNIGFQQPAQNQGLLSAQLFGNSNAMPNSSNLLLNMDEVRSSHQQMQQQQHHQVQSQQPLFLKQTNLAFSTGMQPANNAPLASPGAKVPKVGISNASLGTNLVQGGLMQGGTTRLAGLRNVHASVDAGSPRHLISSDAIAKNNLDTSSLSPSPYGLNEGGRGRRSGSTLEKVVERRRRRMIKNRESAARSRARKQAYTLELEAEVSKLKELNQKLQKKQAEFIEMQKNKMLETVKMPWSGKRRCLRRTLTGPW